MLMWIREATGTNPVDPPMEITHRFWVQAETSALTTLQTLPLFKVCLQYFQLFAKQASDFLGVGVGYSLAQGDDLVQ